MSAKKIIVIVAVVLVLAGVVIASILHGQASVIKVATGRAVRQDLTSIVNGTGQIKPLTYVNVGATAFGRITHLYVKEGEHVKAGATLATVESVQPQATVTAQEASIAAAHTDITSFLAAEKTAEANIAQGQADLEQKKLDYIRAQSLYNEKLIAKQDFDAKKAAYDMSAATLAQRQAALAQARAQTDSQRGHTNQAIASQRANYDALDKTISRAPFDGLVTNVPVREGETVVVGIQNAGGSTIMTLADMSVITAEVKVDETDIVNVSLNQASEDLRPGLSATAKITTAHKPSVLIIPIQALVQRDPAQEKILAANGGKLPTNGAATPAGAATRPQLVQGVYVLQTDHKKQRVRFVPVATGITGSTDIEVLSGLKDGDQIVTGRYRILRALKSGTAVKVDNTVEVTETEKS